MILLPLFIVTVQASKGALVSLADGYAFDLDAGTYCVVDQTMLEYQVWLRTLHQLVHTYIFLI